MPACCRTTQCRRCAASAKAAIERDVDLGVGPEVQVSLFAFTGVVRRFVFCRADGQQHVGHALAVGSRFRRLSDEFVRPGPGHGPVLDEGLALGLPQRFQTVPGLH